MQSSGGIKPFDSTDKARVKPKTPISIKWLRMARRGRGLVVAGGIFPAIVHRSKSAALALLLLAVPWIGSAGALEVGANARVIEVVDGDTVVLADGNQVRLVGIQAPKLPLGRTHFPAWPLAEEAKAELQRLVLDRTVGLGYGGARRDRHGRILAHLHLPDGTWVQGALLASGMARVYTFADNRALSREMLGLEREARAKGRGIWSNDFYRILSPDDAERHIDSFQLVEGRIEAVAVVRGRAFLNFGRNWRTDFTVEIDPADLKAFRESGLDPKALEGRRVRARGWLKSRNGPAIQATHPEQIELVPN